MMSWIRDLNIRHKIKHIIRESKCYLILGIITIIILGHGNIAYCGTFGDSNATTELQDIVWEMFENMNQEEVDEFGRRIHFRLEPRTGWHPDTNIAEMQRTRMESIILFTMGTVVLFVISRYGRDILHTLYGMGRDLIQDAIPQIIDNFFPRQAVRDFTLRLLDTPEGRERVMQTIQHINNLRRGAGG